MNIAIDYDGTIDRYPYSWDSAIRCFPSDVLFYLVTSRHEVDKGFVREWLDEMGFNIHPGRIICTSGAAKRWFCEQRGLKIDVWIDDDPACIENGK